MKRTFIAIKIPVSKQTAEFIQDIKSELRNDKINWVEIFQMHITLYFLGDTEDEMIEKISYHLGELLKNQTPFKLNCKGLGLFKNLSNPRVLWLGIEESVQLQNLKTRIDGLMKNLGFEIEKRAFKPHLTLGRIKYIKDKEKLKNLLERYNDFEFQEFKIDKLIFYESRLTSDGPIYKAIKEILLN
ncbi:MAG: RNA 2',3'-cyclic phosphodiesterase [Bacteroidales bacterium]